MVLAVISSPRSEQLTAEIASQSGIPAQGQVVFSTNYDLYLSQHTTMTPQQFSEFLQLAGGAQGHALLYLLPIPDISDVMEPEYRTLAKLSKPMDLEVTVVHEMSSVMFSSEIMVHCLY